MKIKELKKIIEDLPDNAEVLLSINGGEIDSFDTTIKKYVSLGQHKERTLYIWGDRYNTREVYNAYGCNDDRYGGRVLCIEVGRESD